MPELPSSSVRELPSFTPAPAERKAAGKAQVDMSPNSRSSMELAQKKSDQRKKDNELHLIAQIKACRCLSLPLFVPLPALGTAP